MTGHEARLLRMAGAKRVCPNPDCPEKQVRDSMDDTRPLCLTCRGAGRVYLLPDAVREECSETRSGWIPLTDPMVWAKALWPPLLSKTFVNEEASNAFWEYIRRFLAGDFPAALETAERALIAAGVIREEVTNG